MDAGDIGRYGTLSLLKRLDIYATVASYPIDDPEITIGRDPNCSIRLYYPAVSALHCKIIFNDNKKAFLVVLGTNGVLVDSCPIFPSPESSRPVMVPLPNDSMIDIHKKRFRFAYPPKHLRPALAALPPTPAASNTPERRRALRMSMIHSAHVFSPRPSADPSANLRVLQSPLKAPFARERRDVEEHDKEAGESESREEEDIVLVESDHPRVVEEGRDLVILDHVTVTVADPPPPTVYSPAPSPARTQQMPVPPQLWAPPRTPARRPPRSSLHRAVLIRSAQRAALRQEMQREEEEMEVEEVEESIVGDEDQGAIAGEGEFGGMEDVQEGDEEFEEEVVEVREHEGRRTPTSGWRKSLEAVKGGLGWAFRAASVEAETRPSDEAETVPSDDTQDEHDETEYANEDEMNYDDDDDEDTQQQHDYQEQPEGELQGSSQQHQATQPDIAQPDTSLAPRPLGRFMTPQGASKRPARASLHVRYSMGGFAPGGLGLSSSVSGASGPRRVRVVEPWKVTDLVVPLSGSGIKEEDHSAVEDIRKAEDGEKGLATPTKRERERASEEERRAIRERRKSALTTPDTFFNGQVPGSRRTSLLPPAPALPALFAGTPVATTVEAASGPSSSSTSGNEDAPSTPVKREDGPEDTQVLLARMRQMVEGVKRRQSVEAGTESPRRMARSVSPKKRRGFSLLAWEQNEAQGEDVGMIEVIQEEQAVDDDRDDVDEQIETDAAHEQPLKTPRVEFSRHLPPSAHSATPNFTGMRDMFKEKPTASAQTPRMDGVREMFFRERASMGMEESALEGVGEMLATPAGWRGKPALGDIASNEEDEADDEDEGSAQEAEASKPPASQAVKGKVPSSSIGLRRTPRSAVQKGALESSLATVKEDGGDPDSGTSTDRKGARVFRRTRTRTAESDQESSNLPRMTRTRKAMSEEPADSQKLPSRTKSAARRKAGTDISEDEAPAKTARRTRQASGSASTTADDTVRTTGAKNTRRTRATRTPVSEEQPSIVATKPSTGRRIAKAKAAEAIDLDNEDDPLDSINAEDAVPAVAAAKVKRTARSRIPVGRVKEEEEEDSPQLSSTDNGNSGPTVARGRKVAAGSASKSAARTRAGTSAQKPTGESSGKTTPSTTDEQDTGFGDKENTPESQGEDDPVVTKGKTVAAAKAPVVTRAKGTRSATKAAARANTEELNSVGQAEASVPDGGKVVSRTGRTRAAAVRR